jgi:hypothetical protein
MARGGLRHLIGEAESTRHLASCGGELAVEEPDEPDELVVEEALRRRGVSGRARRQCGDRPLQSIPLGEQFVRVPQPCLELRAPSWPCGHEATDPREQTRAADHGRELFELADLGVGPRLGPRGVRHRGPPPARAGAPARAATRGAGRAGRRRRPGSARSRGARGRRTADAQAPARRRPAAARGRRGMPWRTRNAMRAPRRRPDATRPPAPAVRRGRAAAPLPELHAAHERWELALFRTGRAGRGSARA